MGRKRFTVRRKQLAANAGYADGYKSGYNRGYDDGYNQGFTNIKETDQTPFSGTSIIIPTFNQRSYLQQCIESIRSNTDKPYEVIVIDNASKDSTAEYLSTLKGAVRYKVNSHNLGFAGAVNQGLAMARGETLLLLNNDTVVTANWLRNMLNVIYSDKSIGIVGPITNYISGPQLVSVQYTNMEQMHRYAAVNNRSDPARWVETKRLTGFCMLMVREVFEAIGYFDEGFEIGNCEDDDYGYRVRLLGRKLMIAHDTFIHHYGSVSIKAVAGINEIYEKNVRYLEEKWNGCNWDYTRKLGSFKRMVDHYPTEIAVQDKENIVYWISKDKRYQVESSEGLDAVRLANTDLQHWPLAGSMSRKKVEQRIRAMGELLPDQSLRSGMIVRLQDGHLYQYDRGSMHKVMNDRAYTTWLLDRRPVIDCLELPTQRWKYGEQLIAPCCIKAENL